MLILNSLPTPVLVTGPMGRVLNLNQALLALISGQASDWLGGSMDAFLPASAQILLQTQIWPLLLHKGHVQEVYLLIQGVDQNDIPVLATCQRQILNGSEAYFWVFSVMQERSRFEQEILSSRNAAHQSATELKLALEASTRLQAQLLVELSEHEVAKQRLKQSQLSLAQAARIAKLGVWRNDHPDPETFDTTESMWSKEMYGLLGYTEQAVPVPTTAAFLCRVHPDDRPLLLAVVKKSLAEKASWQTEYRLVRPDGNECLVEESGEFIFDMNGDVQTMMGVVKDVTDKKKAELYLALHRDHLEELVRDRTSALIESERETKSVNRSLHMLSRCNIAIVHATDEHQLLNELCQQICECGDFLLAWVGLIPKGLKSALVPVAQYGHASGYLKSIQTSWAIEQETNAGPIFSALSTAQTQLSLNYGNDPANILWREPGQAVHARSLIALPLLFDGHILGVLTIHSQHAHAFLDSEVSLLEELARNISFGLKTLRERHELDRYQLKLEDLVATRTAELSEAKNTADAANLAKSSFLATMSHELRTPLNAIIGLSGLMVGTDLNLRQKDYAQKIQLSGNTLCALIDDILDFSKIESGEVNLHLAPFSLKELLLTVHEIAFINTGVMSIEFVFDVAMDIPDSLIGDELRLRQIVLNLCSNAIKFTHVGEIVLSVRCLQLGATEVALQFSISDTGIGIPLDKQSSIFDEFTQADSSISRTFGGTGLGLSISARLVRLMGGEISVASSPGLGSVFSFQVNLPLGPNRQAAVDRHLPLGLRVLVVDDHPLAREIQIRHCLSLGWLPTGMASGPEGIDELRRSVEVACPYDILLLDWRMPGMDGLEMLQLAQNLIDTSLPLVILMSPASELAQADLAAAEFGLHGLVAKPLLIDALKEAVLRAYAAEFTEILPTLGKPNRPLSGVRLLVAEDNLLNQEVIEQVLTQAGACVVMVSNGLAAVAALRVKEPNFDVVLMDIQMPVMDGYTATRIIREELGLTDLPIIAVTANARPDDRDKTRQAGMVGHLVKPLNVKDLLALVAQFCKSSEPVLLPPIHFGQGSLSAKSSVPEVVMAIDTTAVLAMFGGQEDKCLQILQKFCTQHSSDVKKIRQLLADQHLQASIDLLHDLCGIAGFLMAKPLAKLTSLAQEALRLGQLNLLPDLLDEIDQAMQAIFFETLEFENRMTMRLNN